ncbi:MAG: hypothetical protein MZW92_77805 [Comamonadaceae bacterium]|nr:hypothetical protein [Comamonadaceae bacterium]
MMALLRRGEAEFGVASARGRPTSKISAAGSTTALRRHADDDRAGVAARTGPAGASRAPDATSTSCRCWWPTARPAPARRSSASTSVWRRRCWRWTGYVFTPGAN